MSTGILLFFKLELQVKTLFINQSLLRVGPSSFDIICAKCHRLYISLYSTLFLSFLSFQVVKVCILSGDWQLDPSKQRRCGRRIPSCPLSPLQVVFSILWWGEFLVEPAPNHSNPGLDTASLRWSTELDLSGCLVAKHWHALELYTRWTIAFKHIDRRYVF